MWTKSFINYIDLVLNRKYKFLKFSKITLFRSDFIYKIFRFLILILSSIIGCVFFIITFILTINFYSESLRIGEVTTINSFIDIDLSIVYIFILFLLVLFYTVLTLSDSVISIVLTFTILIISLIPLVKLLSSLPLLIVDICLEFIAWILDRQDLDKQLTKWSLIFFVVFGFIDILLS